MVVGAMIEFAILLHMKRTCEHRVLDEIVSSENTNLFEPNCRDELGVKNSESLLHSDKKFVVLEAAIKKERTTYLYQSHKIDYIAFLIFGSSFLIFNFCYWNYYLYL